MTDESVDPPFRAGLTQRASGSPRHMMTINTMYVVELTEPAVYRCALMPRLTAPPTIGPADLAACQTARKNPRSFGEGYPIMIAPSLLSVRYVKELTREYWATRKGDTHADQKKPADIPSRAEANSMNHVVADLLFVYSPAP